MYAIAVNTTVVYILRMSREDPQLKLRLAPDLKNRVQDAARTNNRTMNAEIVARLESTFSNSQMIASDTFAGMDAETLIKQTVQAVLRTVRPDISGKVIVNFSDPSLIGSETKSRVKTKAR